MKDKKNKNKKKKILFVIQSLRMGGAERVQVTLANKLVEAGYDVTVLVWKPIFDNESELDERVRLIYKAPDRHLGNRIPYIRYKFYDDCMWELRATPRQLYRYYVGRKKYDIEIAFFHGLALEIIGGSDNKAALRFAWVHHDLEKLKEAIPKRWDLQVEMYHRIRNIVCVSQASRDTFIRTIGDTGNVQVIYNMLPAARIRQQAQEKPGVTVKKSKFHLVMSGRYVATKGYERLIRSVVRLRGEGKDISLALIGDGDDKAVICDMIQSAGAGDYISTVNGYNNPYPYVKEADLLVCASFTEGYNLTVAEALILSVPVLSTDCSGPREILDNGRYGMLVENSEEGLYKGLKELYESPELLEEYRRKASGRMDFFDEDRILKQITDLFEGSEAK